MGTEKVGNLLDEKTEVKYFLNCKLSRMLFHPTEHKMSLGIFQLRNKNMLMERPQAYGTLASRVQRIHNFEENKSFQFKSVEIANFQKMYFEYY